MRSFAVTSIVHGSGLDLSRRRTDARIALAAALVAACTASDVPAVPPAVPPPTCDAPARLAALSAIGTAAYAARKH